MSHGNGAAPGVHQLRGKFYGALLTKFVAARIPPHLLHPEHEGCQVHCLVRRVAVIDQEMASEVGRLSGRARRAEEKDGEEMDSGRSAKRSKK